jgi:hypothetical protein
MSEEISISDTTLVMEQEDETLDLLKMLWQDPSTFVP